ncbi:MAG: Spy/CpxP family protein refolding chaperone [bacterium]|nr:Spy/CpxP family protein refolding chaperone [bacterium]
MSEILNTEEQTSQKNKRRFFCTTKSKVILSIVIILFTVLAVKGIAVARHFHKFADGPGGFIIERLTENLNLTESQKAQVERIREQIKQKMETNKPDHENDAEAFAGEFKKDKLDINKLKEFAQKKEQKHDEMKEFMMEKIVEFHDILTPDQRNQAVENMKDMKNKFHDRTGKFKDGDRDDKRDKFDKRNN